MIDLTVADLIKEYQTDPVSPYHTLRHRTRVNDGGTLRRIAQEQWTIELSGQARVIRPGTMKLGDIKYRTLLEWHKAWSKDGEHMPMAHAMMAKIRVIVGFGLKILEDKECERLAGVLHRMKFPQGGAREQIIAVGHIVALRAEAHKEGCPSIALAQAIQFEGTFRQKDIIGEWVPISEPGVSDITSKDYGKWDRGIRWHQIDDNLVLVHVTSKKQKKVTVDLKLAPMVIEELQAMYCELGETLTRARLPASGPVIIDEETGLPYLTHKFRRCWRELARAVGIPDDQQQRDTRATAITEGTDAGADLESVRHAASHSNVAMTGRYSRNAAKKTAEVMKQRAAHRLAELERYGEQSIREEEEILREIDAKRA